MRNWSRQWLCYIGVGAIAGLTDLSIYSLLTALLHLHPLHANLISRPIGGLVSFSLNKFWTFENRGHASTGVQFSRYACVWLVCFTGSETLVGVYHAVLRLGPIATKIAAEATLGIFSFLCQKFWTFR